MQSPTRFACLTLLALLALNSICWISFFIHCHQAVNEAPSTSSSSNPQAPSTGGHLILTFATSNLLISLLICCSQRKQLKRACQLLGLSRFVALAGGHCCQLADATKSSPASSSSVSSSSYYNHHHHAANGADLHNGELQHQLHHHQQSMGHYGTGKSIKISSAASQQSLFVVSRSRPVGSVAEIAQPTYGQQQAYQQQHHLHHANYPMLANQHLYQQLAGAGAGSQQHIYDSTSNLNGASPAELAEQQKQRQLSAFQLSMAQQQNHRQQQQQQQQQFNQHEPMIHYTLGRPFNGSQFHLNQPQQQQQQQFFQGTGNMTLKPMPSTASQQQMSFAAHQQQQQQQQGARSNQQHEPALMCPINGAKTHSASSSGRQHPFQQQQQAQVQQLSASSSSSSGEADGPLVALAQTTTPTLNKRRHEFSIAAASNQSKSPATFGPMHYNMNTTNNHQINSNNNNNSRQATEHRPSSNNNDNQSFVEVIGHGGSGANHCTGAARLDQANATGKPIKHNNCDQADQQQHLANKQAASSQNYTDALKAAMAQEANQQHFRRTNSTAMRQQQQPHRSFASSSATNPAMIDAQLDYQPRPIEFGGGQGDMLAAAAAASKQHDSNIYDVANCGQLVSR